MPCNFAENDPETDLSFISLGVEFLCFRCYQLTVKHDQPLYFTILINQDILPKYLLFILHALGADQSSRLQIPGDKKWHED